ncbi:MAG: DUF2325 domain-containing protein [Spirochaetaceae bacterium]|jgi:hypothetical protein|nr:DUF2325 domain-containing protein [Spirochaetaceae bacterium]
MYAVLIGGLDRLYQTYIETARSLGVELKVFNGRERSIKKQLGSADMLILCTNRVSHSAKREAVKHAGIKQIPLHMIHSAGISALRCCIEECPLRNTCAESCL